MLSKAFKNHVFAHYKKVLLVLHYTRDIEKSILN